MKKRAGNEENRIIRSRLYTSVLLVLLALGRLQRRRWRGFPLRTGARSGR